MLSLMAQNLTGIVNNNKNQKPLDMVSVVAFDDKDNPVTFSQTDENGDFVLEIPEGTSVSYFTFSTLGYAKVKTVVGDFVNGSTILMKQEATNLKEVVVKSNRLRQNGDTLTYSVAGFRQGQDRSIADVIAKMPGLEVSENGQIKFQGQPINKFYIEGMDLMGGKYSMASENLSAAKVKDVQVLKNHQPVKSLKGVKFSDQAALNLVLEEDAKNVWNGSAEIGAGMQLQEGDGQNLLRDGRLVAMNFGKKVQSITMYKWNNTGKNIQDEVEDLTSESGFEENSSSWLSNISIAAPQLKSKRYRCNDTRILATNWLRKLGKDDHLRLQATYLFDKSIGYQYYQTIYTNILGGAMIEQESDASLFRREGTVNLQYKLNSDKFYINNIVKGEINWNQSDANTRLNGVETHQRIQPRKRMLSDDFKLIKNVSGNRSFSMNALANYQYLPGLLALGDSLNEHLNLTTKSMQVGTGFRHRLLGFYINYVAQINYSRQEAELLLNEHGEAYQQHVDGMLTPMLTFNRYGLKLSTAVPLKLADYRMDNDRMSCFHIQPKVSLSYQVAGTTEAKISYIRNVQPFQFNSTCALPYYSSYISQKKGNGKLTEISLNYLTTELSYENPINGLFMNVSGDYQGIQDIPLFQSKLNGNVYESTMTHLRTTQETYSLKGEICEAIALGKLSFTIGGEVQWNKHKQLIGEEINRCINSFSEAYFKFSLMPIPQFSLEENSTCYFSRQKNITNPAYSTERLKSYQHSLKIYVMPKPWILEWAHELYHSNDKSVSTNYFSDIKIAYRKKKHEMSITINNIFGTTSYNREIITDNYRQYSINHLRPREIIAKMAFYL